MRWLDAPEADVEAAAQDIPTEPTPPTGHTGRRLLAHLSSWLMLCYLAVVWTIVGSQVQARGEGLQRSEMVAVVIAMVLFVVGAWGSLKLYDWSALPTREARIRASRAALVAEANGFQAEPVRRAHFSSLITGEARKAHCFPRFVGPGIEFGNLTARVQNAVPWHYIAVTLPQPQPHLVLDAVIDGPLPNELSRPQPEQRIRLGGEFDDAFHLYAPRAYATDALFLLPPDVMATLVDHAAQYNIEVIDHYLIFFRSGPADFSRPGAWKAVDSLRRHAIPALLARADRYRDQDVPVPEDEPDELTARRRAARLAVIEEMGWHWMRPAPTIGAVGRRLQMHRRRLTWPLVRSRLWYILLFVLYVTPASTAFGGFMSAITGW